MNAFEMQKLNAEALGAEPRQPSAILAELWAVKAKLNAEAAYDMDNLIAIVRRDAAPYIDENGRVRVSTPAIQTPPLPAHDH